MGWTYDGDPMHSDKDAVRFLIGDTVTSRQLLQDEEIEWLLTQEANIYMAAAACANNLCSRNRGVKSKSVGGLSISWGADEWERLSNTLRLRGKTYQGISAGGIEKSDRDSLWEDASLIRPQFWDDIHQDPTTLPPARSSDVTDEELP